MTDVTPSNHSFLLLNYQTRIARSCSSKHIQGLDDRLRFLLETLHVFGVRWRFSGLSGGINGGAPLPPVVQHARDGHVVFRGAVSAFADEGPRIIATKSEVGYLFIAGLWFGSSVVETSIAAAKMGLNVVVIDDISADFDEDTFNAGRAYLDNVGIRRISCVQYFLLMQNTFQSDELSNEKIEVLRLSSGVPAFHVLFSRARTDID